MAKSPSQLENTLTAAQIADPSQVHFGVDKLDGTPGSYKITAAEVQKLSQRIDSVYNQQTNSPALTNATGAGKAYQVLPQATAQTRDFGAGPITFPARTPGLLVHNGTVWTFYPYHSFSPATQIPNDSQYVSTIYFPTTGEASNFVSGTGIQGPTIVFYRGNGTVAEPDYAWFVDRLNVVTCIAAPGKSGGKRYTMPNDAVSTPNAPTDTEANLYVQQQGIRGPAILIHLGAGGTASDPNFAWYIESENSSAIRIKEPSAGGEGEPGAAVWGAIGGTLSEQDDLVDALALRQPRTTNLDNLSSAPQQPFGVGVLGAGDADDLAGMIGIQSMLTTGTNGQVWTKQGNTLGIFGWANPAPGGGGGGTSSPGLFQVVATGDIANDNAAVASAVSAAKSYGNGAVIEFLPNGNNREINLTTVHLFDQVAVSLRGAPGFRGFILHDTTSGFQWGSDILPWNYPNVSAIPLGMARDTSQFDNPTVFSLVVTATGGNYTLTFNGSTTGNILFSSNSTQILAALNAVPALNGRFTVAGSGTASSPFRFTPTATGGLSGALITGSVATGGLTGGTATLTNTMPTVGRWYAFWSDQDVAEATWHSLNPLNPMRPCEFHRIGRQVQENRAFTLEMNATGGTYRLTINGLTTGDITWNADQTAAQNAINAVSGLNGNITVSTVAGKLVFTAAGSFAGIHNTGSITTGNLTGGGGNPATFTASSVVPAAKWLIEDTIYDQMVSGLSFFAEIPTIHGVKIENISARSVGGFIPLGPFLALYGCVEFDMRNVRMGDDNWRFNPGHILCVFCSGSQTNVVIADNENPNATMGDLTYGMVDICNNRILRTNCLFGATRHGYTTAARARTISGVSYRYGCTLNAVFESCLWRFNPRYHLTDGRQESQAIFDTHSESARVLLNNCQFYIPPNQVGLLIRGRDVVVQNATIYAADSAFPVLVQATRFKMIGGLIDGGFYSEVRNGSGTQPNVDEAMFLGVTWQNCGYTVLVFDTGTNHVVDSCKFLGSGGGIVNSPWMPSGPVYIRNLTNTTTARIRITNNTAPRFNNTCFVYPGSITYQQLIYDNNIVPGYDGAGNIGIARLRNAHGTDQHGAANSPIAATVEWEITFGTRNGKPKYDYIQQSNHVLTNSELYRPITSLHEVYDDTSEDLVNGWLVDVPYNGQAGGGSGGWYVLASSGMTIEAPKSLVSNTYNPGSESRELWWDASAGSLVATRPNDSHPNATPLAYTNCYSANLFQFTVPYRAVLAGNLATMQIDDAGNLSLTGGLLLTELASAPGATAANKGLIYAIDNAGKTRISARFLTSPAQTIATEPT